MVVNGSSARRSSRTVVDKDSTEYRPGHASKVVISRRYGDPIGDKTSETIKASRAQQEKERTYEYQYEKKLAELLAFGIDEETAKERAEKWAKNKINLGKDFEDTEYNPGTDEREDTDDEWIENNLAGARTSLRHRLGGISSERSIRSALRKEYGDLRRRDLGDGRR